MKNKAYINDQDAFTTWGVVFDDDLLERLRMPPELKDLISNDSPSSHGETILLGSPKVKSRTFPLTIRLYADSEADLNTKVQAFNNVLLAGTFKLRIVRFGVTYNLVYRKTTAFSALKGGIAKYVLSLKEPNPMDRTT